MTANPALRMLLALWFAAAFPVFGPAIAGETQKNEVRKYSYEVINTYPHDPDAFTQGLFFEDGYIYESTGLYGESTLRKVEPKSGYVLKERRLPEQLFAEGITIRGEHIYQLTWKSNLGFIYDKENLNHLHTFTFPGEGWGLTSDDDRLIVSSGSSTLNFLDPDTFVRTGTLQVTMEGAPLSGLNELEYIDGEIWANVWPLQLIVSIDPETGVVTGLLDLSDILGVMDYSDAMDVMNGIAYDAENETLFVTGKLWHKLYEIVIIKKAE